MKCDYIIIQAGGKGTRMKGLTANKPKALVPVNNLPMIFHLFKKYPSGKFIIIGDYKYDVLKKYLDAFADVEYTLICASDYKGTCAGISEALEYIPENECFMLIWCDLILPEDYEIPDSKDNIIGISKDFFCRWKYEDGKFAEERSRLHGVAGHFIFQNKSYLRDIPTDGEFVKWLQHKAYRFTEQELYHTHEYGLFEEWEKLPKSRCRPFNCIKVEGNKVYKTAIDRQGEELAVYEVAWYKKLQEMHFKNIPKIYEYNPFCMERIDGKNIYEYTDIPLDQKINILKSIIDCLKQIHKLGSTTADRISYKIAYIEKTYSRLQKVQYLIPFADKNKITINGRTCRNIFYYQKEFEKLVMEYFPNEFRIIHGDCTFSNILLKYDAIPVLIDPRGYFGTTELYGDVAYDWAKIYYSLFSNYDQFNLKRFSVKIIEDNVELKIRSNKWEIMEEEFFRLVGDEITKRHMLLLLAIIWLSLTTYSWEDYDSICGAFYNGIYYLEEAFTS